VHLPFSSEQFLSVFQEYNQAVWPMQILLNLLGLFAVFLGVRKRSFSSRAIALTLSFLWLWTGLAYQFAFFASINPAAKIFAALDIIQGILFLGFGTLSQRLSFRFSPTVFGFIGALLMFYAMLLYPLLGIVLGHLYPRSPTFGLPCPTTIFTFGILLWTEGRFPRILLLIPAVWAVIGFSAALTLGIYEDTGLLLAALLGVILILLRERSARKGEPGDGRSAEPG
jgi:hypothetical protein